MYAVVSRKACKQALASITRVASNFPRLPAYSHTLIRAEGQSLHLAATDLDLGLEISIPAQVFSEGEVAVPARTLENIATKLSRKADMKLQSTESGLEIQSGTDRFVVSTMNPKEFPLLVMPIAAESVGLEVPASTLRDMVRRASSAAEDPKVSSSPVYTGLLLQGNKKTLALVSTDGRRLARSSCVLSTAVPKVNAIVPARTLKELARLLQDDQMVEILVDRERVSFATKEFRLASRLIEGTYPRYEAVIPKDHMRVMRVRRADLEEALNLVLAISDKKSPCEVDLSVRGESLTLSVKTQNSEEARKEIPGRLEGPPLDIVFNGRFLLEGVRVLCEEEISLSFGANEVSALVIRPEGESDHTSMYLVMPIRRTERVPYTYYCGPF